MWIGSGTSAFLLLLMAAPVRLQDDCVGNSCYPNLGDLMVGRAAQLKASSTCGLYTPQKYCILGDLENENKCLICDSRSPYSVLYNPNSHRIENVITTFKPERKMRWWQSENGVHEVSIQLDLESMFQFSHLIMTFKSFRPAAMLVERSKDFGRTWKVFRYFAGDCARSFPGVSTGPADRIDDLICESRYSQTEPSTDGEVVLKALDPRFEIHDPYSPTIQELITVTNLRVNFTRLITLGDFFSRRKRRNPQDIYYYALYDMVVRGSCFCNGHASQCVPVDGSRGDTFSEPGMVHGRCVCQHNTAGYNCERCQDFYHDAPWRPGGISDSDVCKRCNCHGHSEKCHFDLARYIATGTVSGGVCEDCRNNRVGSQCELCGPYYYQDPQRSLEDPYACIPCECSPDGSVDNGLCNPVTGQCVCKQNVEGERCDRCKFGFYGFNRDDPTGCQLCRCNFMGTISTGNPCDQTTGRCICDHFAYGPQCDQCLPGYWGLGNTVYGCLPCECDIGGALKMECSSVDGQCQCRPNMVGQRCSEPASGYFLAPLDFYIYEAENAAPLGTLSPFVEPPPLIYPPEQIPERPTKLPLCPPAPRPTPIPYKEPETPVTRPSPTPYNPHITLPVCEHYLRQRGYDFKISNGRVVVVKREKRRIRRRRQNQRTIPFEPGSPLQIILRQRAPDRAATWTGLGFVRVQDGSGLRFTVRNIPAALDCYVVIRYEPESTDDWTAIVNIVSFGSGDRRCLTDPSDKIFTLPGSGRTATLDLPVCLSDGNHYHVDVTFRKQPNADPRTSSHILIDSLGLIPKVDTLPNFCSQSYLTQFQQYRCIELGTQTGDHSLPEVCETLIGSMSAFIHNGAVSCNCHQVGAYGTSCSKFGGQCECKPNVIGRCCDSCAPLTYGLGPNGCSPCDCDPSGSTSELCDQTTGQCSCRDGVTGRRCDKCYPGYYGFPLCRRCQCNGLADICDPVTGDCLDCREHAAGAHCERCKNGYVGDPLSGQSCEPCLCPDLNGSGRFFAVSCNKDSYSGAPYCECLRGHTGQHCDYCAPGYYGDPRLPGGRCIECCCNNNIDPRDGDACDSVTGECLRCLHNTEGPRCQSCRLGYYGNALAQDCRECSCDRRGTEENQCPPGSPCFCDQVTGQCLCRRSVEGVLCDECVDGYWNLDFGCEPCNCDPEHTLSYVCDKITGQCLCQPEYGGRKCNECGPNHFGNPDIQCMSCDCNMEGTIYPACDTYTGECLCKPGVTGLFCDECAPGHDNNFPTCEPCHDCYHLWEQIVSDVRVDAERIETMMPCPEDFRPRPGLQRLQDLLEELQRLVNMNGRDELKKLEELCARIRNETDTMDPHIIIIDQSVLLNTDIDNIRLEFNRVLNNLREKTKALPVTDGKAINDMFNKIQKLYDEFTDSEKKVEAAKKVQDASRKTRENATLALAKCRIGEMEKLERKVNALSVGNLNEQVCGAPGDAECEKAKCGGALCGTCGGPACTGSLPISLNASKLAEMTEKNITDLQSKLKEADAKLKDTSKVSNYIKDQAEDMMNKINQTKSKYEQEKMDTKNLIEKVKDYLQDEMVKPEDIDKLANAVLSIQLPKSPDEIKDMIKDIKNLLANVTDFSEDLEHLEKQAKIAENIKERAKEILNRTEAIDVREIEKTLNDTAELHDKISNDLDETVENNDIIRNKVNETEPKLQNIEDNLNLTRAEKLLDEISALKNKTEMNRAQGTEARDAADIALTSAKDVEKDLEELKEQFEKLKRNSTDQNVTEEVNERLKNITMEAEKLAKDMEDKMKKVEDLEKRILAANERKEEKLKDLEQLQKEADDLKNFIVSKVEEYALCTT